MQDIQILPRKHDFTEVFIVIFLETLEVYIMIIVEEYSSFIG